MPKPSELLQRVTWRGWTALILAVLVILALTIARLLDDPSDKDNSESRSTKTDTQYASPTLPHDGDAAGGHDNQPEKVQAPQAAIDVAEAFVREWATHPENETPDQWWSRVSPYAHPDLAKKLRHVDPSRIPATKVLGVPRVVDTSETNTELRFRTDAAPVLITCVLIGGVWTVGDIDSEIQD